MNASRVQTQNALQSIHESQLARTNYLRKQLDTLRTEVVDALHDFDIGTMSLSSVDALRARLLKAVHDAQPKGR